MLKKVAVNQLTVGVFVHGFDESWLKHPFWRNKFLIKDQGMLREVQGQPLPELGDPLVFARSNSKASALTNPRETLAPCAPRIRCGPRPVRPAAGSWPS